MSMVLFKQFSLAIRASRIVKVDLIRLKTQMVPRDDEGNPAGFLTRLLLPSKIKMVEVVSRKPQLKLALIDGSNQFLSFWRGDPKDTDIALYREAEKLAEDAFLQTVMAVSSGGAVVWVSRTGEDSQKGPEPVAPDQDAEANAQARPQARVGGDDAAQA